MPPVSASVQNRNSDPTAPVLGAVSGPPFSQGRYLDGFFVFKHTVLNRLTQLPWVCRALRSGWRWQAGFPIITGTAAVGFGAAAATQHTQDNPVWADNATATGILAALTGFGVYTARNSYRMYQAAASVFGGRCPDVGDRHFRMQVPMTSRMMFPSYGAVPLTLLNGGMDDIRPPQLRRPSDPPVVPATVDPEVLLAGRHGVGTRLPEPEAVGLPGRRLPKPVVDDVGPFASGGDTGDTIGVIRDEFSGALASNGSLAFIVDMGGEGMEIFSSVHGLPPPLSPPATNNNVDAWIAGKGELGDLGKEAAAFGVATADPCLGAAVLMSNCRSQRVISSPTLWLTGPAHKDLAKFAVGVVGVTAVGVGIWVHLGRAGAAAAAAW